VTGAGVTGTGMTGTGMTGTGASQEQGATELGPSGIGVHLVRPGTIDTPMAWGAVADVVAVER